MSALEERILSAENESKVLQERLNSLIEEKTGIENEMVLLRESLQTAEKEKKVCGCSEMPVRISLTFFLLLDVLYGIPTEFPF